MCLTLHRMRASQPLRACLLCHVVPLSTSCVASLGWAAGWPSWAGRGWWLVELKASRLTWARNLNRGPRTSRQGQTFGRKRAQFSGRLTRSRTDTGLSSLDTSNAVESTLQEMKGAATVRPKVCDDPKQLYKMKSACWWSRRVSIRNGRRSEDTQPVVQPRIQDRELQRASL
jgi:hypothetical protein